MTPTQQIRELLEYLTRWQSKDGADVVVEVAQEALTHLTALEKGAGDDESVTCICSDGGEWCDICQPPHAEDSILREKLSYLHGCYRNQRPPTFELVKFFSEYYALKTRVPTIENFKDQSLTAKPEKTVTDYTALDDLRALVYLWKAHCDLHDIEHPECDDKAQMVFHYRRVKAALTPPVGAAEVSEDKKQ